jgi:plasmid stabilization system protein ParE
MAGKSKQVVYSGIAHEQILTIMLFIAKKGYPDTSIKFCDQLYDFGETLGSYPEKYTICHHNPFKKRNLRCAPFKNFVFIYSVSEAAVTILAIIHSSRLK